MRKKSFRFVKFTNFITKTANKQKKNCIKFAAHQCPSQFLHKQLKIWLKIAHKRKYFPFFRRILRFLFFGKALEHIAPAFSDADLCQAHSFLSRTARETQAKRAKNGKKTQKAVEKVFNAHGARLKTAKRSKASSRYGRDNPSHTQRRKRQKNNVLFTF